MSFNDENVMVPSLLSHLNMIEVVAVHNGTSILEL
jgi:hypothetical protein